MEVAIHEHSWRRASSFTGFGRFSTTSYSLGSCLVAQALSARMMANARYLISPPGSSKGRDGGSPDGMVGQLGGRGMRLDVLHVVERHQQQHAVHLDEELARLQDLLYPEQLCVLV